MTAPGEPTPAEPKRSAFGADALLGALWYVLLFGGTAAIAGWTYWLVSR